MGPSPILRKPDRDLCRLIGPLMVVTFKLRISLSVRNNNGRFNLNVEGQYISGTSQT